MHKGSSTRWAFPTTLGNIGVDWTDEGLSHLEIGVGKTTKSPSQLPDWLKALSKRIQIHLGGKPQDFSDVPVSISRGSEFFSKIYAKTRQIPLGEVWTYQQLAAAVKNPGAMRAVGQAMGRNPIPIIVPCHRVIAKSGPGGYTGALGLVTKERLLALEGVALKPPTLLTERGVIAKGLKFLIAKDKKLGAWINRHGTFAFDLEQKGDLYGAFVRSIIFQQLTGKAAQTIMERVAKAVGYRGKWDPSLVLKTSPEELRAAGLSGAKAAALIDLSQFAIAGRFPSDDKIQRMTNEALIASLSQIRGIGPWSVEMMLMFHMKRADVFSGTDYGLRKGFAKLYRQKDLPPPKALEAYAAEHWRPYRTIAAWYLWRAAEELSD